MQLIGNIHTSPGRVIAAEVAGFTAAVVVTAFTTRGAAGTSITRLRSIGTTSTAAFRKEKKIERNILSHSDSKHWS
jgi:hypothetical protein